MISAVAYLEDLQSEGRYHFTTVQVVEALGVHLLAARVALGWLKQKGRIADPRGGHAVLRAQFEANFETNLDSRARAPSFRGDLSPLLRPGYACDFDKSMILVLEHLIHRLPGTAWKGRGEQQSPGDGQS